MLSWVMCWLHGHVVCDGSVMVGKMGEAGWGEWVGGWSITCINQTIPLPIWLKIDVYSVQLQNPSQNI